MWVLGSGIGFDSISVGCKSLLQSACKNNVLYSSCGVGVDGPLSHYQKEQLYTTKSLKD